MSSATEDESHCNGDFWVFEADDVEGSVAEVFNVVSLAGTTVVESCGVEDGSGTVSGWLTAADVESAASVASRVSPIGRTTGLGRIVAFGARWGVASSLPPVAVCWLSRWLRRFAICDRRKVCINRGPREAKNISVVAVFTGGLVALFAILYMADWRNTMWARVLELAEVLAATDGCEFGSFSVATTGEVLSSLLAATFPVVLPNLFATLLAKSVFDLPPLSVLFVRA